MTGSRLSSGMKVPGAVQVAEKVGRADRADDPAVLVLDDDDLALGLFEALHDLGERGLFLDHRKVLLGDLGDRAVELFDGKVGDRQPLELADVDEAAVDVLVELRRKYALEAHRER